MIIIDWTYGTVDTAVISAQSTILNWSVTPSLAVVSVGPGETWIVPEKSRTWTIPRCSRDWIVPEKSRTWETKQPR